MHLRSAQNSLPVWPAAILLAVAAALVFAVGSDSVSAAERVSFRHDVMAVLSKAGCNQGTCHGNQNGKNGFKLSLRGEDDRYDHRALVRDQLGRRLNELDPDASLLLLKAIGRVPHGGGSRFDIDSLEYHTLRDWIAQGHHNDPPDAPRLTALDATPSEQFLVEPENEFQIKVTARFSDGTARDVSRWAVYSPTAPLVSISDDGHVSGERAGETTVLVRYLDRQAAVQIALVPARPDFVWSEPQANNYIDRHVFAKLRRLRMNPSELAGDVVFLRRAYFDLLGVLPTSDEAQEFVKDASPDKRSKLIDRLLKRPEFADCWALKWSDLLRNEEKALDRKGVQTFHHWIRQAIVDRMPMDRFVRELVASRGSTYVNPPANYYRANRDPITRGEATAQLFLGTRLQCAKCHNHPFDRWTQDDYYNWATLFSRVRYKLIEVRRSDKLDKHEFEGEQVVWMDRAGEVKNPRTDRPAEPRVLGDAQAHLEDEQDRLEFLADWITSPENPLFARVQVNRIWFQLLGRGIVDPLDDFRATNVPVNSPLLDALAADFVAHDFDLQHLIRTIMNSRVYQLSSVANPTNADDESNFSHTQLRPLTAEPLLDALNRVTGVTARFSGYPRGMRAGELPGVGARRRGEPRGSESQFLEKFGKPERLLTCECERSSEATLGQAFQLISGPTINALLTKLDNRLDRWLASGESNREMVADVYWTALSRGPSDDELGRMAGLLDRATDRRQVLEDIVWALVNSKEFVLRQ